MLDAVKSDNATERFRADLEHLCCVFGGVNFQNIEIDSVRVFTWETTDKNPWRVLLALYSRTLKNWSSLRA